MGKRNKRRQVIVNKELQSKLITVVSWPIITALGITAVLLGVMCTNVSKEAALAGINLPSLLPMACTAGSFILVAAAFTLYQTLMFSHRIAGPIYRFARTLEAFRKGDSTARARFRKGDILTDVADHLNEFLDWLEEKNPNLDKPEATAEQASEQAGEDSDSQPADDDAVAQQPAS